MENFNIYIKNTFPQELIVLTHKKLNNIDQLENYFVVHTEQANEKNLAKPELKHQILSKSYN